MKRTLSGLLLLMILASCAKQGPWLGTVYPDKTNRHTHKRMGNFGSVEACLQVVMPAAGRGGAYECGLNCSEGFGVPKVLLCDKIVSDEDE